MSKQTVSVASLGFPRIGLQRELIFAFEAFWPCDNRKRGLLETVSEKAWIGHFARGNREAT
jgi:hypothetical protein